MSCSVRELSKDQLESSGAMGEKRTVLDLTKFNNINKEMTEFAYVKYNVGDGQTPLYNIKSNRVNYADGGYRTVTRVEPNDRLLDILQLSVDESGQDLVYPFNINKLDELLDPTQPEKLTVIPKEPINNEELDKHTTEFVLFNGYDNSTYSSTEILGNIIDNYPEFTKVTKQFLNLSKVLVANTKAKVKIIDSKDLTEDDNFMEYNASNNTIYISKEKLDRASTEEAVQKFLHEVVHSVTIGAYQNPTTFEQKEFKIFIDESFKMYKHLNKKDIYGFTNQEEFIAEVMTNPAFQEELRATDVEAKKQSWWNSFIERVRRLLGVRKIPEYNAIVDSITTIIPTEQQLGKGIFATKTEEQDIYSTLKTSKDKVDYTVDRLKESLSLNISNYRRLERFIPDESKKENIQKYIKTLVDLQESIDKYTDAAKIQGVIEFMDSMKASLNYIHSNLNSIDTEDEKAVTNAVKIYKNYLSTYSVIEDIENLVADLTKDKDQELLTDEDLSNLEKDLINAKGTYSFLNKKIFGLMKDAMRFKLNDIKYFPQVEKKHKDRLAKEYKDSHIPEDKQSWIVDKMLYRDKDLIQEDLNDYIEELLENPIMDIANFNVNWNSSVNVSSTFVQIMNQMLVELDNERIKTEKIKDKEFAKLFKELVAEKGTNNIKKLYENIIEYDKNGKPFLRGEYSIDFYNEVHLKIREIKAEYDEKITKQREDLVTIPKKYGYQSDEYLAAQKKLSDLIVEKLKTVTAFEEKHLNFDSSGELISIKDKWKNKKPLSTTEQKVVEFFNDIVDKSHKQTYGQGSLVTFSFGTRFRELPKVTKSDVERFWTGDVKGLTTDKIQDFTKVKPDDVGYTTRKTDLHNEQLYQLKVHYRDVDGTFSNDQQSLDLMTIMRLEYKNGNMFEIRKKAETDLTFLLDIAKDKDYYEKTGTTKILNWRNKKLNVVSGKETNTVKMMTNMLENRFYDIMHHTGTKVAGVDLNKAVGFINKLSAMFTLTFNVASGTANVLNANAQLFLESFLTGQHITASSIAKANKIYAMNMGDNIKDISNPINNSYINQINEMFNIRGIFNLSNANFLQSDILKAGLDSSSLQVFQETGEHWIQSVISLSVLDGVKVMNSTGNFINKDGKVVKTEKEAASLLDMTTVDQKTGLVTTSDKVVYTTHSMITKYHEGGKEKIDLLIRKKLYDSLGNYTEIDQPEIMRHWYGKLVMLYRKYLIPMGSSRFTGLAYSLKNKKDLTEDEKNFSYALQVDEEGTYVSLIRFISTAIKNKKLSLLTADWKSLTDYEKHNIKRSVVEVVMTSVMLPLMTMFASGLADGDDDETLYFIAYQLRRLETELSQYRDPSEMYKVLRSPIPSARLLETAASLMFGVLDPSTYTETYQQGKFKGENKWKIKAQKQIPVVKEVMRDYESLYNYQDNLFGAGL